MKRPSLTSIGTCLVLLLTQLACDKKGSDQSAPESSELSVELPTELSVDPDLLSKGRILLTTAQKAGEVGMLRIPGEVVSSPDGAAEVGVLAAGRIAKIDANLGDAVEKGKVLAWVDSPEVGGARAEVQRSRANLELQKSRLARQEQLSKEGATSQSNLDEARAAVAQAEAAYSSAALLLGALGATSGSGSRFALLSPIDGVVTESTAVLGAMARPEQLLFRVIAPEKVLIVARFPEGKERVVASGRKVQIVPRGFSGPLKCEAIVETNANVVDPHTRTVLVRLRPEASCQQLRPGAYVEVIPISGAESGGADASKRPTTGEDDKATTVQAPEAPDQAVQVETQAVVYVRGRETVFVADETPGKFYARPVHVLSVGSEFSTIDEGLAPGERVVTRGTILLKGEMLREVLGGD